MKVVILSEIAFYQHLQQLDSKVFQNALGFIYLKRYRQSRHRVMNIRRQKILAYILLIILIGFVSFDYFGPRMILQVNGGLYSILRPTKIESIQTPKDFGLSAEKININTIDDLTLSAYLVESNTEIQKGTIILLHGIRVDKEHLLPIAKRLADSSFNSVLIDLRAHGKSEGKFCTYGFLEKVDISILVDSIINKLDFSDNIGIWGQSLGGAVALQSMAMDSSIRFGIIESTFSDFDTIVHDYFKYHLGFDIPFMTNYLIKRTRKITYFEPSDVKPYRCARKIEQPIIIAHGRKDKRISIDYGLKNFENISSTQKKFIEIPEANHLNLWKIGGEEYFEKIFSFINEQRIDSK